MSSMVCSERCSLYNSELPNSIGYIDRLLFIVIYCLRSILHMSVFHKSSAWVYYPNLVIQREPEAGEAKKLALSWVIQLLVSTAKSMMTYLPAFQHPLHITLYSPCSPASLSPTFYPLRMLVFVLVCLELTSPSPTPLYTINSQPFPKP